MNNLKRAIVVGASSGIGRALAEQLAVNNWMVGITGRRKNLLLDLYTKYPGKIIPMAFDNLSDDVEDHLDLLIAQLGGLDLLVLSSGTGEINTTLEWRIEENTLLLNVKAWTRIADFTYNYFSKQGYGHFTAITSIASIRGEGRAPAYNASKSFQANYLEGLRKKAVYSKLPLTVTDIQPGFVKTDMAKGKGRFWEASADKAASQIFKAIVRKKNKAYITKRWWLIAQLLKIMPDYIYNRI